MNKKCREKLQSQLDDLKSYQDSAGHPRSLDEVKELKLNFKLDAYFDIFDRIELESGWVIDYLYGGSHLGSEPLIIVYKKEKENEYRKRVLRLCGLETEELTYLEKNREETELERFLDSDAVDNFLKHIKLDGSAESYLQFTLLAELADQFALFWHALYNDKEIILTDAAVERILKRFDDKKEDDYSFIDEFSIKKARNLNLDPEVIIDQDKVKLRLLYFTKWGGFIESSYLIKKEFPHQIVGRENNTLIDYHCGVNY